MQTHVKVMLPSVHAMVPTSSHVAPRQSSVSLSHSGPSHPGKHSHRKLSGPVDRHVPLLQSARSQGSKGMGEGVAETVRSASDVVGKKGKRSEVVSSGKISDRSRLVVTATLDESEGSGGTSVGEGERSSMMVDSSWRMSDELAGRRISNELTSTGVSDGISADVGMKGAE